MEARNRFREGWIMLLRPFKFGELSKPLQKMTILYAYSEQPIINMELTEEGKNLLKEAHDNIDKPFGPMIGQSNIWRRGFGEASDEFYNHRISVQLDAIYKQYAKQENYKGEIVQCYVEKQLCRFYPEEYNVISRETFEHLLSCDEQEYQIEVEDSKIFDLPEMKTKLHYLMSRGISRESAMKMNSNDVKDSVIFRPQQAILEIFCRDHEIY